MTPFPGTPQFAQMKREGRLLHEDWGLYNCANVVFQPKHFTVDELSALYLDLWRTFYKDLRPLEVKRRYVRVFSRDILDSDAW
jgi:isoleucyl-tRNA synthetase